MNRTRVWQLVVAGGLIVGSLVPGTAGWADDTQELKQQVQALQERVGQLESQLADKQAVVTTAAVPAYDVYQDPFAQMMRVQAQMERNMQQAIVNSGAVFSPKMDMKQTDKKYIITMDIPGMDKDKINVEIKKDMLIVSGERQSESEDNNQNQYFRQERSFGSFMQAIPLPEDAKKDQIEAHYKDGVLTVIVQRLKKEDREAENQKITVN